MTGEFLNVDGGIMALGGWADVARPPRRLGVCPRVAAAFPPCRFPQVPFRHLLERVSVS